MVKNILNEIICMLEKEIIDIQNNIYNVSSEIDTLYINCIDIIFELKRNKYKDDENITCEIIEDKCKQTLNSYIKKHLIKKIKTKNSNDTKNIVCKLEFKLENLENEYTYLNNKKIAIEEAQIYYSNKKSPVRGKGRIPANMRKLVWKTYIGDHIPIHKCLSCKKQEIRIDKFHCGHIISEKNGGKIVLDNLRPICADRNSGMGTMSMIEYIKKYEFFC